MASNRLTPQPPTRFRPATLGPSKARALPHIGRDFVRNDIAYLRRPAPTTAAGTELDSAAEATVNNVNSLIQRVAGTSLAEIENLIGELEGLRDLLHSEGQRVQREISGYAQLSQAAMKSTRMIADNVAQWKLAADGLRHG